MNRTPLQPCLLLITAAILCLSLPADAAPLLPADPDCILIETAEDLQKINDNLSGHYMLACDIDLSEATGWKPIGYGENPFTGTFNGNGYRITGFKDERTLTLTETFYEGLFGYAHQAEIHDLGVEGAGIHVTLESQSGEQGFYGGLGAIFEECEVSRCYVSGDIQVYGKGAVRVRAGGLIGLASACRISDCYTTGSVYAGAESGGNVDIMSGGIAAWASDNTEILRCFSKMGVGAGGLTDWQQENGNTSSFNTVMSMFDYLEGVDGYAGGIAGSGREFIVTACFALNDRLYSTNVSSAISHKGNSFSNYALENLPDRADDGQNQPEKITQEEAVKNTYADCGWDFDENWFLNRSLTTPVLKMQIRRHWGEFDVSEEPYKGAKKWWANDHYYKVFEMPLSWYDARDYAESLGGHLASLTSPSEWEYVSSLEMSSEKKYWTGLYIVEGEEEGDWTTQEQWEDPGTDEHAWIPDRSYAYIREDLALAITAIPGEWDKENTPAQAGLADVFSPFVRVGGFICEWE